MTPTQVTIVKKPTSGTFVLTLLVSIALVLFLLIPKLKAYNAAKDANKVANESLQTVQDAKEKLAGLYVNIGNQKSDLAKLDTAVPNKTDISSVYALIERFAKSSNLALSSVQGIDDADIPPNEKTGEDLHPISPTLGVITVNLQVTGSVEGFTQFLSALEQSLRFIDVQTIDISQEKDQSSLTFRTTLRTYYQK